MSTTGGLAALKQVIPEFDALEISDAANVEKRWTAWLENFEICTDFEGIDDEKKLRAALLAVGGPQLRELHKTLEEIKPNTFQTAKDALNAHFKGKKNITAERYRFLCTKPEGTEESHDSWITRLKKIGVDCEWDKFNLKEAIKLAVIMHTRSAKLQAEIIASDMNYEKMVEKARALELTRKELDNLKQGEGAFKIEAITGNSGYQQGGYQQAANMGRGRSGSRRGVSFRDSAYRGSGRMGNQGYRERNTTTVAPRSDAPGVCKSCGFRATDRHDCRAKHEICLQCNAKGHYARMCPRRKEVNELCVNNAADTGQQYEFDNLEFALDAVEQGSSAKADSRYPSTEMTVTIAGRRVPIKIDSGAEATVISRNIYEQIEHCAKMKGIKIALKHTTAKLKPFNSPALKLRGSFEAQINTKKSSIHTTIYVTDNHSGRALLSKYAAFDLGVLRIEADMLTRGMTDNHVVTRKTVPEVEHLEYTEIQKHLSTDSQIQAKWKGMKTAPNSTERVEEMLKLFPRQFEGIGCHRFRTIKLDIDTTVPPKVQAQRRIPFAKRDGLEEVLNELEEEDILEEVQGPTDWISNLVLTPKADNKLRMNIDMTTANAAIQRTRHVIPTIEELKYELNGATVFSKLDMRQGYMQFQLHPESRHMTTFYTHRGLRRMKRLNFGTNSAAELFQEEVRKTISDITNCRNTYDDIIVYGKNQQEHNEALFRVLQRFADCGLTFKREKCEFNQSEIKFFGYIFDKRGMRPDPEKVAAIRAAKEPESTTEMRSFLGMCNFCSHFIPNFSIITGPLREMTKKNAQFEWTTERRRAFQELKQALQLETTLIYFDPNRDTRLYVDGSKKDGVGSILAQKDPETGRYRPVRYDSRALTDPETRYSQIDIESMAIYAGIMKCHIYLYGLKSFEVVTDHQPLLPLYNKFKENMPPRVKHHKIMTQGYNYTVRYEKGASNPSDYLSRHPITTSVDADECQEQWDMEVDALLKWIAPDAVSVQRLRQHTADCPQMQQLKAAIEQGYIGGNQTDTQPYKKMFEELSVENGIILRGEQLIIPESLQREIIQIAHEAHLGRLKTSALIKETMWFPAIDRKVNELLDGCLACAAAVKKPQREPLKSTVLPAHPWTHLVTDFFGPVPTGEYLLVVQDTYSRFPVVEVLHSTAAEPVIAALDRIMSLYGIPEELGSDNGPPYNSERLQKFAQYMGYSHNHKIPYAPWANGTAENFMKNLKKLLQVCQVEQKNWKQHLQRFLRAYRATTHSTTGFAPATLLFNGRQYRTRLPATTAPAGKFHEQVQANDKRAKTVMKQQYDSKQYVKENEIQPGDQILIAQPRINKATPAYNPHPFTVVTRNGSQIRARRGVQVVERHANHCKIFRSHTEEEGEGEELECQSDTESEQENTNDTNEPAATEEAATTEAAPAASSQEDTAGGVRQLRPRTRIQKPARFREGST